MNLINQLLYRIARLLMSEWDEFDELIVVPYSQAPICDLNTRPALLWRKTEGIMYSHQRDP